MNVVLLTSDLIVSSRVEGAALRNGIDLRTVTSAEAAVQSCVERSPDKLIVDLGTPSLDVAKLVARVKRGSGNSPHIVAFGPHVHAELLANARQAGCDEVVSRGQFFSQLEGMLSCTAP